MFECPMKCGREQWGFQQDRRHGAASNDASTRRRRITLGRRGRAHAGMRRIAGADATSVYHGCRLSGCLEACWERRTAAGTGTAEGADLVPLTCTRVRPAS